MESSKFDELTKALATPTSRRQAFKTIAATMLGSMLGLAGIGTALAAPKCHRNGLGCDTNSNCCSNYCANGKCTCPPTPACNDTCSCPTGQSCQNGTCCQSSGSHCSQNSDCCGGFCNSQGTCGCLPSGTALSVCSDFTASECCSRCCIAYTNPPICC
jgi:hypothetical protein